MSTSRYEPIVKIASGGMATVYLGALRGPAGFRQLVALKRPHEHLLEDASFKDAFLSEARLAALLHHSNVVDVRDIEETDHGVQLVMDYVEGASLGQLLVAWSKGGPAVTAAIAIRVTLDACAGLHAAHELAGDDGRPLGLVHRDVSPQNILLGVDGVARVTDFGLAKCTNVTQGATTQGTLKGKIGYMAPEYVRGRVTDRRADIFAMGVVLWEALAGKRLFRGETEPDSIERIVHASAQPLGELVPGMPRAIDDAVARALTKDPAARWATAADFGAALEAAARPAHLVAERGAVGALVRAAFGAELDSRRALASRSVSASGLTGQSDSVSASASAHTAAPRRAPWMALGFAVVALVALAAVAPFALRNRSANATTANANPTSAARPTSAASPVSSPPTAPLNSTPPASQTTPTLPTNTDPATAPSIPSSSAVSSPRPRPSARPRLPPPNPYTTK